MIRNCSDTTLDVFETDLGWMAVLTGPQGLLRLSFGHATAGDAFAAMGTAADAAGPQEGDRTLVSKLIAYAAGRRTQFDDLLLDLTGTTDFQRRVLARCRAIPFGETLGYGQLVLEVHAPNAARAVGNVMRANRFPLIVPCHRVVNADGSLGSFSAPGGCHTKAKLLRLEGVEAVFTLRRTKVLAS